jgi:hypothetical protein
MLTQEHLKLIRRVAQQSTKLNLILFGCVLVLSVALVFLPGRPAQKYALVDAPVNGYVHLRDGATMTLESTTDCLIWLPETGCVLRSDTRRAEIRVLPPLTECR